MNEQTNPQPTALTQLSNWLRESTGLKLFILGFLLLLLLIPLSQIESLMHERQNRSQEAIREVSDKWSRKQTLAGPIMALPYESRLEIKNNLGQTEIITKIKEAYFMPENLQVSGTIEPDILHRGIFDVVVYSSDLHFSGNFLPLELQKLKIDLETVLWKDAYLIIGLNDLRGIKENLVFQFGEERFTAEGGVKSQG